MSTPVRQDAIASTFFAAAAPNAPMKRRESLRANTKKLSAAGLRTSLAIAFAAVADADVAVEPPAEPTEQETAAFKKLCKRDRDESDDDEVEQAASSALSPPLSSRPPSPSPESPKQKKQKLEEDVYAPQSPGIDYSPVSPTYGASSPGYSPVSPLYDGSEAGDEDMKFPKPCECVPGDTRYTPDQKCPCWMTGDSEPCPCFFP